MNHRHDKSVYIWAPSNSASDLSTESRRRVNGILEDHGFTIYVSSSIDQNYLGLGIVDRNAKTEDLKHFLSSSYGVLLPVFGGYTSGLLLPELENVQFSKESIVCGKSDLTSLLNAIYTLSGKQTLYGVDCGKLSNPYLSSSDLLILLNAIGKRDVFFRNAENYNDGLWYLSSGSPKNTYKPRWETINFHDDFVEGIAVGGNIESFTTLTGTKYMPSLKNKVLMLEGVVDTNPKKFLMNLNQLIQGTDLFNAKALIIGTFGPTNPLSSTEVMNGILIEQLNLRDLPIIYNVDFSHSEPSYPFVIGGKIILRVDTNTVTSSWI